MSMFQCLQHLVRHFIPPLPFLPHHIKSSTPGTRCTVSAHAISADILNNKHNAPLHAPAQSPLHAPPQNDPPQASSSQASQNPTPQLYGRMVDLLYQEKLTSFPEMFTLSPVGNSPSKAQLRNLENQKVRILWWFSDDECPELFKADCATHPYFQPALDLVPSLCKAFPEDPQFTKFLLRHVCVKQCLDFEKYNTSPTARRLRDTNNK
ncbi:hypothetical protein JR316_0003284 [Psilocybe cubensis]|uniref:Uncharacterized protein n=2 Tax=Psilocybe cubensis TaxID=181762 RepID=A0ACB8H8H3_PSICU|nr:hypothetical protein JR316_0003284 [Psilocybe cubensis]KAH9483806.1 hypothetical protein JR316_0003284 [Psilocybe cubensis]